MKDFKVAVAQMNMKLGDKKENMEKAEGFVSKATAAGADFVVLPEYLPTGSTPERFDELAEPASGPSVHELQRMSKQYDIHIAASLVQEEKGGLYNTAVLTGRKGELLATYRKVHLFMDEQEYVENGTETVTVDTEFGRVGLMICYDTVFPEVARRMAMDGADIILVPANWPDPFKHQWQLATSSRALDNQLWVAAANRVGSDEKFSYFGCSRVVNPYGIPVAECGDEEGLAIAEITSDSAREFKGIVDFIRDMQPLP